MIPAGSQSYLAEDGSFRVGFPAGGQLSDMSAYGPGFGQVFYTTKGGSVCQVAWTMTTNPDPKPAVLRDNLDKLAPGGQAEDFQSNGHPALTVQAKTAEGLNYGRRFLGKDRIFTIIASPRKGESDAFVKPFLDSFQPDLEKPVAADRANVTWRPFQAEDASFTCLLPEKFQGEAATDTYAGFCTYPGRQIRVSWREGNGLDKARANLDKNKNFVVSRKDVTKSGVQGLESVLKSNSAFGAEVGPPLGFRDHFLLLAGKKRTFQVQVSGLDGDASLETDARKVFDSFKPTNT